MVQGIPYDSPEGVATAGAITAIMHMKAYETSAELAGELGPFEGYERNKEHMLRVMRNHKRAAYNESSEAYEGLTVTHLELTRSIARLLVTRCPRNGRRSRKKRRETWVP